uniref:SHSP domain-containing protein n=1 Tax=Angiostrongylus cantonensis TaxID=6313 RepID=A0A0K0DKA5_ANGCA
MHSIPTLASMDDQRKLFFRLAPYFQIGVSSPDWDSNLAKQNDKAIRNCGNYNINGIGGNGVINVDVGGRRYTVQLPPNSSMSVRKTFVNGQMI